ncbi:MAG TPA: hypothetical protein VMS17_25505 [Gemmataceae bacterium]|nr:hypothetical protein [Gemmataceae bacterium]
MKALLSKLWADDKGAVMAAELVLIIGLTVIGIIPGLVALRNAENATLADIGNALLAINLDFSFSGFAILGSATPGTGGTTIAQVGGVSFATTNVTFFYSSEGLGNVYTVPAVNPAP